jgi:hypothetical protein
MLRRAGLGSERVTLTGSVAAPGPQRGSYVDRPAEAVSARGSTASLAGGEGVGTGTVARAEAGPIVLPHNTRCWISGVNHALNHTVP